MTSEALALDAGELRVVTADIAERLVVLAGPGSGKTETVRSRIEFLVEEFDATGEEILVISFSRAAVEAVQRRRLANGSTDWVWITTLDSLAARMLVDTGNELDGVTFDMRIRRATDVLNDQGLDAVLPQLRHVIVDECQDVVGVRTSFIAAILASLPDDVGFTLLGDPLQGIYDFAAVGSTGDVDLPAVGQSLGAQTVHLHGQYRAESPETRRAMATRSDMQNLPAWISSMEAELASTLTLNLERLVEYIGRGGGDVAVLVQTNAQALSLASQLWARGVSAQLAEKSIERGIDPWVAQVLGPGPASLSREEFVNRARGTCPSDPAEAWVLLRRLVGANSGFLNVQDVARRLSAGIVPVALGRARAQVVVSTVHRVKGLEFDRVVILDPDSWFVEGDEARARMMYVAMTRPRRRLVRLDSVDQAWRWEKSEPSGRLFKRVARSKGTVGVEIKGSDCCTTRPPGRTGAEVAVQERLSELAADLTPEPVEFRFNAYHSTLSRPHYDVFLGEMEIGSLSERFVDEFVHKIHPGQSNWPGIGSDAFLTGVETCAGPLQDGPVGANGLWLVARVEGPATLDWRKK